LLLFVREPERSSFRIRLANLASHEDREPWECTLKPRKGETFPASITVGQVRDGRGTVVGLRWLIRDVRDRVHAEQAALEREKILELEAEVGAALTESGPPSVLLQRCAQASARHLDAA